MLRLPSRPAFNMMSARLCEAHHVSRQQLAGVCDIEAVDNAPMRTNDKEGCVYVFANHV